MAGEIDLKVLQSESRNPKSTNIDALSTRELCNIINDEDQTVADAVRECLPTIASAVDALTAVVKEGGKVVYVGAGTSGRLGVLDASELPPTYSADPSQFVALIAGGDQALRHAQEGAEDDAEQAVCDLRNISLRHGDALIGIAASGRTPYVLSCLRYAKATGCATVGVACSSPSAMSKCGDVDSMIEAVTGAEVVTGSTRMKAGTATKMVLNMLSTGVQIKLGKTYGNMMVDVKSTNLKLQQRARNIIREVCASTASDLELDKLLEESDGSVKLAIAMVHLNVSAVIAKERLEDSGGVLAKLLHAPRSMTDGNTRGHYVLCIDGGGSKCAAYVLAGNGEIGIAIGPACNVTTSSPELAAATIRHVAEEAMQKLPSLRDQAMHDIEFDRVWIGLAGCDRPRIATDLRPMLEELFHTEARQRVRITNDLQLLATAAGGSEAEDVCVLVAGTGSIAMAFSQTPTGYTQTARAGGWGPLLGDDGSGFDIGRQAIRHVLELSDDHKFHTEEGDELANAVLAHLDIAKNSDTVQEVLSSVLLEGHKDDARKRIAGVARVVIEQQHSSTAASQIIDRSIANIVNLLKRLDRSETAATKLVMTGGLLNAALYREQLQQAVAASGIRFASFEVVLEPGLAGARSLLAAINKDP